MAAVSILGAGNWGTTLALLLCRKGHRVSLWEFFPSLAQDLITFRENRTSLAGFRIPDEILITADLEEGVQGCEVVVFVVPSQVLRGVAQALGGMVAPGTLLVSAVKGIENGSLLRVTEILESVLPCGAGWSTSVLSGPSIANEVIRGIPTAVTAAARQQEVARRVQEIFIAPSFRVYTSPDVVGVELGGALKNVIAIAAGILDGLALGANTKGALLTRGLAEMARLGVKLGARPETFAGLSGMGDLITTCFSQHSRNRRVGEGIGRGQRLPEILSCLGMVAEGVETTRAVCDLAAREGVEMPISEQVRAVLHSGKDPRQAVSELMGREPKAEVWGLI
jgi:glycerol-3-phosphate dehydrogenase (NAD(P)+)